MTETSDVACIAGHEQREPAAFGNLCRKHRRQLDDHAREIGHLIVDTQRITDGGAPRDHGPRIRHTKSAEAPPPGDLVIMALYDSRTKATRIAPTAADPDGDQSDPMPAVLHIVASWLLLVAEERPLTETRHRYIFPSNRPVYVAYTVPMRLPDSVLAQLDLLVRHHDWVAGREWVDDYLLELSELRKALAAAVHDRPVTRRGTCNLPTETAAKCGGSLLEVNGTSVVRCTGCGAQWVTDQERARLALSLESA